MLNVGGNKKKPYNQLRTFPDMNYKIQIQDNDLIGVMNGNLEDMDFFYFETTNKIFGQTYLL